MTFYPQELKKPNCILFDIFRNDSYIIHKYLQQKNFQKYFVQMKDIKNSAKIFSWNEVFDFISRQCKINR